MNSELLLDIARDWSYWDRAPAASTARKLDLPAELRSELALVIQGVRRCGKSTLLSQMPKRYRLDRQKCLFVNFEDPRLSGSLDAAMLRAMVDAFDAWRGKGCTFFFDEVQVVEGWQAFLRSELDRKTGRTFVVTGSNAHLLSGEVASKLTGRNLKVELYPFDLDEYRSLKPKASVENYLHDGGFPGPLATEDADRLRASYFNDIVERDVRERVAARSSQPLRRLAQLLFESAGSELSLRRAAAALGVAVDTVSLYVDAIEDAYLAFACPFFSWSERKRSVRNKKWYPVDPGLRRVVVTQTGKDLGKSLECAVYLSLRRKFGEVSYWRGRGEVDFVVLRDGKPLPVQVAWKGPEPRHERALEEFYGEHAGAQEALFVTASTFEDFEAELE
jgi:uncharacterized protein